MSDNSGCLAPIIVVGVIGWIIFGTPAKDIANWFWKYDAAPWETVDLFFYPDRNDLSQYDVFRGLADVAECRNMIGAAQNKYRGQFSGSYDYECGVGYLERFGSMSVYRTTVR